MLKIHVDAELLLVFKVKIISWNVNSLRAREPLVQKIIEKEKPNILCIQELKIDDIVNVNLVFFDHDKKRLQYKMEMIHKENKYLASTIEVLALYVDFTKATTKASEVASGQYKAPGQ